MSTPDISAAAPRLCAACGMCCDGVLFHIVRLQPGESPKAFAALGLKVKRKRGESHCVQPCAAHRDSQCAIYASRPQRCRAFECRQLRLVAAGAISEAQAREKIGEAALLIAEMESLLLRIGGSNESRHLSKRCEQAMAEPLDAADAAAAESRSRLTSAKSRLDALLERDFRIEPITPHSPPSGGA